MPSETYTPDGRRVQPVLSESDVNIHERLTAVNYNNGNVYMQIVNDDSSVGNPMIGTLELTGNMTVDYNKFVTMLTDEFESDSNGSGIDIDVDFNTAVTEIQDGDSYNCYVSFIYDGYDNADDEGYTARDISLHRTWLY